MHLDGVLVGRTPIEFEAAPRDHELILREPGFRETRRSLRVTAGGTISLEPVLAPLDADDDAALRRIAQDMQIPLARFDAPTGTRGGADAAARPLLPRGAVRPEDAAEWTVEVGPEFEPRGRIVFVVGDRTLHEEPFEPTRLGEARGTMSPVVLEALRRGEIVSWGWAPPRGEAQMTVMQAAAPGADRPACDVARTLGDAPDASRQVQAQCLLDAGLVIAAYRLAAEHVDAHPASARGWALAFECLRRAGLEESSAANRARQAFDALPAAARAAVLRER